MVTKERLKDLISKTGRWTIEGNIATNKKDDKTFIEMGTNIVGFYFLSGAGPVTIRVSYEDLDCTEGENLYSPALAKCGVVPVLNI